MKKLEDALLQLKFDTDSTDYSSGQKEAIKFYHFSCLKDIFLF